MENQPSKQTQQRIQQIETVAGHYTNAANALKAEDEQQCFDFLKQASESAAQVKQYLPGSATDNTDEY